MSKNKINNKINSDEIDLRTVFLTISNFFIGVIYTYFKNYKIVASLILIGSIFGLIINFTAKPVYKSEMTVSSKYLNNDYCQKILSNLNALLEEKNIHQTAFLLKISEDNAEKLLKIKYKNLNDKYDVDKRDTVVLHVPFTIEAKVRENEILDTLEVAIVRYLSENYYAKKRETIDKENLKSKIQKLNEELLSMDSLKRMASKNINPRGNQNAFVFGQAYEPLNVYKAGIELYDKQLNYRKLLVLNESIEIVSGFTKYDKPASPNLFKLLVLGGLAGFAFSTLILISMPILKSVKRHANKKESEEAEDLVAEKQEVLVS